MACPWGWRVCSDAVAAKERAIARTARDAGEPDGGASVTTSIAQSTGAVEAAPATWPRRKCPPSQASSPADVDGGKVAVRESKLRYCIRELNGARQGDNPQQRAEIVHGVLTAALAAQPGGSDNDR